AITAALPIRPETLTALRKTRADGLGDETFVREAALRWSYGEFGRRVREIAAGLRELGVGHGDVVSIILPNCPAFLEAWWGVLWAGCAFNPANPAFTWR